VDDRDLLFQELPAVFDIVEGQTEPGVFLPPPPGADADLDAPIADQVDRQGRPGEDRRGPEGDRRHERAEPQRRGALGERPEDRPRIGRPDARDAVCAEVVIGPEEPLQAVAFGSIGEGAPVGPGDALLALDHQARPHAR
jgi:hypothetical protein